MIRDHLLIALALITAAAVPARADVTYIPVVSGLFTTGQWYFEGERSSLAGNAGITFVPAFKFSERFSIIPSIDSSYRGTRSMEELAGGNTLFQDTWENGVGVKGVHGLGEGWNLRERVGYRFKWFRETTDESWSNGLYDYQIITGGAEIERHWGKRASVSLGYDLSYLRFPNYSSLESAQGPDLAREYAGDHVLDNTIQMFSLKSAAPIGLGMTGSLQLYLSPRNYTDQTVVLASGLLSEEKREDTATGATLSTERTFRTFGKTRLNAVVFYGYTGVDSTQNHYDAEKTTFIADFYDYKQNAVGTQLSLGLPRSSGGPMVIDAGISYSQRNYDSRVIQNVDGDYMSEKLNITEMTTSFGFSYPLSKNFRARAVSSFGRSRSNNDYEAVYRYNYSNASYQFGFTYDY